ncbi:S8 family serine peptidase [Nocardioides sp. AE5]|uniref:S8 family serine peptidase n=1 Tax=Nocardioides sp. AE5 TaxID=2962573 RepID=UPI00288254A7|nr:S8 family serine peptidase [Nocardioides sp. AE5]MDT0202155.1 S8 family serine peptidase [Nocardioides sp. AE5]
MPLSDLSGRRQRSVLLALFVAGALAVTALFATPAVADDPSVRKAEWWLDTLSAEKVWAEHTRGAGITVAVVDSGVDPSGDLAGAVLPGFRYDGTGRGDRVNESNPHGTMMATYIAGRGTGRGMLGIAPEAMILPVLMTDVGNARQATQALRTLAAMEDPPEVVSMSFVSTAKCDGDMQQAVTEAIEAGMVLVAGTGNLHRDGVTEDTQMSPASCAGVVAVGAYGWSGSNHPNGEPELSLWEDSQWASYQTVVAPGEDMLAFVPGESGSVTSAGTSNATALASGSLALVRAAHPDLDPRQVVARMLATARPLSTIGTGKDTPTTEPIPGEGYGAIRPLQAIEAEVAEDAPNPVFDRLDDLEATDTASPGNEAGPGAGEAPEGAESGSGTSDDSVVVPVVLAVGLGLVLLVGLGFLLLRSRRPAAR